jgi:hypothetical protein
MFKTVRLIRRIQNPHPDNLQRYRLYISQLQDLSTLGVVEAFTEEAPQVRVRRDQRLRMEQVWRGVRLCVHEHFVFS